MPSSVMQNSGFPEDGSVVGQRLTKPLGRARTMTAEEFERHGRVVELGTCETAFGHVRLLEHMISGSG